MFDVFLRDTLLLEQTALMPNTTTASRLRPGVISESDDDGGGPEIVERRKCASAEKYLIRAARNENIAELPTRNIAIKRNREISVARPRDSGDRGDCR